MKIRVFLLIHISLLCITASAQTIRSKITDKASGLALEGATITVGNVKTISAADGSFSISCAGGKNLLVSFVGYLPQTINISTCTAPATIELVPDPAQLEAIRLGSSASGKDLLSIPQSIVRLSTVELNRGTGLYFDDAIQTNVPGVSMNRRSVGGGQQLNIRGYGNGTRGTRGISSNFDGQGYKVYLNGIVLTDAEGITTFDDIDFASIGNVEITKGPAGTLYGLAIAGAMNLSSVKPQKGKTSLSQQLMAGNYGLWRSTTTLQTAGEKSSLLLNYGNQRSDGYTLHNASKKNYANLVAEFQPSSKQNVTTYFGYSNSYDERAGELTVTQYETDDYSGNPEYIKRNAHSNVITFRAGISHNYQFNRTISNNTSVFGTSFNSNASSAGGWTDKATTNYGLRSVFNVKFDLSSSITLTSVTGIELQKQNANTMGYSMKQDPNDTSSKWVYGVSPYWVINAATSNVYTESTTGSLFTEWALNLPHQLTFTAGIGGSNLDLFLHDRFNAELANRPAIYQKKYNNMISPHFAINKEIANKYSFYASYSKGYKPPVSSYFYITVPAVATTPPTPPSGRLNTDLAPESGAQFEIGTKGRILDDRLFYELTYFNTVFENKMTSVAVSSPVAPNTTLYSYVVNGGRQLHKGVEFNTRFAAIRDGAGVLKMLNLFGNMTYSDFKYGDNFKFQRSATVTEDYSNNAVAAVPKWVFNAGVDFGFSYGFYGNIVYNFRDKMPITSLNDLYTKQYSLLNTRIGNRQQLGKKFNMDVYAGINNLTGEKYFTMVFANQLPDAYVPAPRKANYFAGINLSYIF